LPILELLVFVSIHVCLENDYVAVDIINSRTKFGLWTALMCLKELLYLSIYTVREIEMGEVDVPEKGGKSKLMGLGRTY